MGSVKLKYVHKITAKGRDYYYFRRAGSQTKLPGAPGSVAFARAYERLSGTDAPLFCATEPGSFSAAVEGYVESAGFTKLAPNSKKLYHCQLGRLCNIFGASPIEDISRAHILSYRDKLSGRPATCNIAMAVLATVFLFAENRGLIGHNPATRLGRLKTGEHLPWTPAAIQTFRDRAPEHLVWAMEMGLCTGQRLGDCLRMQWNHIEGGVMHVKQGKTGAEVWVPLPLPLREVLVTIPKRSTRILTTAAGKPWSITNFGKAFRSARKKLGLPFVFHGLRKSSAAALADAGCSAHEIQSITGHATIAQVEHYTKSADQKRLAKAAIIKLEIATKENVPEA